MLVSYASMARILADEQLTGRLHIVPQVIFTISEVLTDETRRDVERAWGKPPFDQYGATEAGGIAAECEHHCGMHLYEDLVITEVVDKDHRPVPPGFYGDKLLITVLFNYAQPLIRYELSDSVRLASEPCLCRRPFARIAAIQGRTEDILYFPTATGGEVAVHPYAFERVMDRVPASGWQVLQEDDGLRVLLSEVPDRFVDNVLVASLRHALVAQGAVVPRIKVQRVTTIPKTAAGKTPLVKSNVPRSGTMKS
jgi:phenylacetate-coenzyme A ligase PaaK-like adenylate-forming protein